MSGSAAAMAGDLIGGDVGDGLAVNLEGSGAVKFHADVMTRQHFHHLVVADMRSFENGGKHCQGFQLALAVDMVPSGFSRLCAGVGIMPPP